MPARWAAVLACLLVGSATLASAAPPPEAAGPRARAIAEVRALRRIPTSAGDRIVIELTREVAYVSGRLTEPDRLFFDFTNAEPIADLVDRAATLSGALVKGLRIGRHDGLTRVVLDLSGAPRYRVYPLTNPFRVVIEIESDAILAASAQADLAQGGGRATAAANVSTLSVGARASREEPPSARYLGAISSFTMAKPATVQEPTDGFTVGSAPTNMPERRESIRASLGLGYVQGADWGADFQAGGSIKGVQVQWDGLATQSARRFGLERGSFSLFDPDRHWRLEGGDLFSSIGGASRGARFSFSSWGKRRPTLAVVTPRSSTSHRPTLVTYRDQIFWRDQTLLDVEVGSDRSYFAATRLSLGRFDAELSQRQVRLDSGLVTDRGVSVGLQLWRGIAVQAGGIRTEHAEGRDEWVTAGLRLPVTRWFELGFDRTLTSVGGTSTSNSAVMAGLMSSRLRLTHRYQWGQTELLLEDVSRSIAREQYQSMSSWTPGPRLNASVQLVTAWNENGRAQSWEEFQATLKVTRLTSFSLATPVQPNGNYDRLRLHLAQQLSKGFSLAADYGQVSPFQSLSRDNGRPRIRVMLSRSFNVDTPARGGHVSGRVLDHAGLPVGGARVVLGPFSMTTTVSGDYAFSPLPAGTYELSIDEEYLPANYAWDGQRVRLDVARSTRERINLGLTPLNALHGRVFLDKNGNGRFDRGEGIERAVVRVGDRVTATDADGAYSFFNLWPDTYAVVLDADRLPDTLAPGDRVSLEVRLDDGRPATGADFIVRPKIKSILWEGRVR